MNFKVVPLSIDPNKPAPTEPQAESGWTVVKGMKKQQPVMPPGGWMPADKFIKALVVEVDTNFDLGDNIQLYIEMARNPIPGNRMLKAIGKICGKPKNAVKDNLPNFLMGHGVKLQSYAIHDSCKDKMTKEMRLNKQQMEAWNTVFYKACFASLIQGPPGTGKTNLVGGMPSTCFLINKLNTICAVYPQTREWFGIIYLPTRGATAADLKEADIDCHAITDAMIAEGMNESGLARIDDYAPWKHIVSSFQR
ncbi:hypothetical protein EYC80_010435 [Monilinia laxa]|uniref:DNA2/NAM7 helicase helicase domain-containing protein n=1 Tax=Monilinia laxa TaxID=61186 RepID=A0A5N6JN15_MONLA|nr:hypothetical protein EYC80_010435 [Monilinia laxa]